MKFVVRYKVERTEILEAMDLKTADKVAKEHVTRMGGILLSVIPVDHPDLQPKKVAIQ